MDDNLSGYWHDNSVECGIKNAVTLQCCGLSTCTYKNSGTSLDSHPRIKETLLIRTVCQYQCHTPFFP